MNMTLLKFTLERVVFVSIIIVAVFIVGWFIGSYIRRKLGEGYNSAKESVTDAVDYVKENPGEVAATAFDWTLYINPFTAIPKLVYEYFQEDDGDTAVDNSTVNNSAVYEPPSHGVPR